MSVYLQDIPLNDALRRFQVVLSEYGLWSEFDAEVIRLDEAALNRVTAETIWAKISSPHYHSAAMDGYAVTSDDTHGALPGSPIQLEVVQTNPLTSKSPKSAQYVDTGDPIPIWANAVIPIENIEALDSVGVITQDIRKPEIIRIRSAVTPWSHVRLMGEDMVATQFVLPAGHILRPVDLGAIAAAGHDQISVRRKPRVAILPTGSELVGIGTLPREGEIIEFNSIVIAAQVRNMGAEAKRYGITKDDYDQICSRIQEAAKDHDLILLNAGSSAGAEDFSARAVERLGKLIVHGVAVRPGHPVILGVVNRLVREPNSMAVVVPIIGVPGYPVSSALTIDIFVEPLIARWLGRSPLTLPEIKGFITKKITSPPGDEDYIRVAVGKVGEKILAAPLGRGAGVISSLVQADGLLVVPPGVQGLEAGEPVTIRLYRSPGELEKTIFCIGSHDLTIDILSQHLAARDRRMASSNAGSIGGLVALSRHEAHLAGSHLLDPATGEFNIPYLKQYLPDINVKVVTLVGREQGLLVQPKNPKKIKNLHDLMNPDVSFINRQRGAGTRVLLDYQLGLLNIFPESIQGYNQEEYTHLGVAAAISSGRADCGLGIAAAAQALGLEFIPLFKERYDLIIPSTYISSTLFVPFFEVLADPNFKKTVAALPGYDVSRMGKIIWED